MLRQASRTLPPAVLRHGLAWVLALATLGATAQPARTLQEEAAAPPRSSLDASLFYQLLIGEIELRNGEAGNAYAVVLDAARRTRDEALFRRAVDIALHARAGDQALAAARAWRQSLPQSMDAPRHELQLLAALNRPAEMAEPLKALLERAPEAERAALIAGLPRLLQRITNKRQAATLMETSLRPYAQTSSTRTATAVAVGRMWSMAGESARALELAERAHADDPTAPGPALLALELLPAQPAAAQKIVLAYLKGPAPEVGVRLAYARALSTAQRYVDAIEQLKQVTRDQPDLPVAWLTLGALQLELRQTQEAEASLQRFLVVHAAGNSAVQGTSSEDDDDDGDDTPRANDGGQTQAWLMLAQAADQRGDSAAASAWLDKIADPSRALEVQTRRAMMLARQGKLQEARLLVQQAPERGPDDARAKALAESQVLREVRRWPEAHAVLVAASARFPATPTCCTSRR